METSNIDQAVAELVKHKDEWARLPIRQKINYLNELRENTKNAAEAWVDLSVNAKQIPSDSQLVGEEWISGPWAFLHNINGLTKTLKLLDSRVEALIKPGKISTRPDGQVVVKVFPSNIYDWLLLNGFSSEVWMQTEVTPDNLNENMAGFYRQDQPDGKVAFVLGAGNIASIPALDVLYRLIAMGHVSLLKMNPVNEYLGPIFEEIFSSFVAAGYFRIVYGGKDVGQYLTGHSGVDEIHLTGSDRTHNAIVFGEGEQGEKRRRENKPILNKPITSELGGVGSVIVVPGPWSDADLKFQAEHIATQKMHNGGFNCISVQVLIFPEEWERSQDFLETLKDTISDLVPRHAYYPGADRRHNDLIRNYPQAELLHENHAVPHALVTGLDHSNADEYSFSNEFFNSALAHTSLPGKDAKEFLKNAVRFANDQLHGTLGVNLIIHPKTIKELGPDLDEAIADLKFGSIAINAWTGANFLLSQNSWGAYPDHPLNDVQSGRGVVHNTLLFDKPQKSIVRGLFYPFPRCLLHGEWHFSPKPSWFVTNKQAHVTGRRFAYYEADPGVRHLPGIFISALRG